MSEKHKHILNKSGKEVDPETLLNYLQNKLSNEHRFDVEESMLNQDFENEAIEGLENIENKKQLPTIINQINKDLRKKINPKKNIRPLLHIKDHFWVYTTLVTLLILIAISYFIIKKLLHA